MQWLLRHYKSLGADPVIGGSLEPQIPASWHSAEPYSHEGRDLNIAVSGAQSSFQDVELARLKDQTSALNLGDGWMVVTIFLGENDLCGHLESCGTNAEQQGRVDTFRRNMDRLLGSLVAWRKRLYINLVELFWISRVASVENTSLRCELTEEIAHECRCLHGSQFNKDERASNAAKLDNVTAGMNGVLVDLAKKYDRIRPDVGVNVAKTLGRSPIPDLSYLSELDCFHPSAKTHHVMSHSLWNSMLRPSKPIDLEDESSLAPLCANATSRMMTIRDQLEVTEPGLSDGSEMIIV